MPKELTRDDILKLEAGPRLDRLVGEAFGMERDDTCHHCFGNDCWVDDGDVFHCRTCQAEMPVQELRWPQFSRDIAAAWSVVESLRAKGWLFSLSEVKAGWSCRAEIYDHHNDRRGVLNHAATPTLAVCRTALLTIP